MYAYMAYIYMWFLLAVSVYTVMLSSCDVSTVVPPATPEKAAPAPGLGEVDK